MPLEGVPAVENNIINLGELYEKESHFKEIIGINNIISNKFKVKYSETDNSDKLFQLINKFLVILNERKDKQYLVPEKNNFIYRKEPEKLICKFILIPKKILVYIDQYGNEERFYTFKGYNPNIKKSFKLTITSKLFSENQSNKLRGQFIDFLAEKMLYVENTKEFLKFLQEVISAKKVQTIYRSAQTGLDMSKENGVLCYNYNDPRLKTPSIYNKKHLQKVFELISSLSYQSMVLLSFITLANKKQYYDDISLSPTFGLYINTEKSETVIQHIGDLIDLFPYYRKSDIYFGLGDTPKLVNDKLVMNKDSILYIQYFTEKNGGESEFDDLREEHFKKTVNYIQNCLKKPYEQNIKKSNDKKLIGALPIIVSNKSYNSPFFLSLSFKEEDVQMLSDDDKQLLSDYINNHLSSFVEQRISFNDIELDFDNFHCVYNYFYYHCDLPFVEAEKHTHLYLSMYKLIYQCVKVSAENVENILHDVYLKYIDKNVDNAPFEIQKPIDEMFEPTNRFLAAINECLKQRNLITSELTDSKSYRLCRHKVTDLDCLVLLNVDGADLFIDWLPDTLSCKKELVAYQCTIKEIFTYMNKSTDLKGLIMGEKIGKGKNTRPDRKLESGGKRYYVLNEKNFKEYMENNGLVGGK